MHRGRQIRYEGTKIICLYSFLSLDLKILLLQKISALQCAHMITRSKLIPPQARNKRKTQEEAANAVGVEHSYCTGCSKSLYALRHRCFWKVQSLPAHSRLLAGVSRRELHEQMAKINEVYKGSRTLPSRLISKSNPPSRHLFFYADVRTAAGVPRTNGP